MQDYLEAVRRKVCNVCIDGVFDAKGAFVRCGLSGDKTCPVEVYLPQVMQIVDSMDSSRMEDYVQVVREKVCPLCEQDESGVCEVRLHADCPLDRYFMLVAGAIEEVRA